MSVPQNQSTMSNTVCIDQRVVPINLSAVPTTYQQATLYSQNQPNMRMFPSESVTQMNRRMTLTEPNEIPNYYADPAYHYSPAHFQHSITPLQQGQLLPHMGVLVTPAPKLQEHNMLLQQMRHPLAHNPSQYGLMLPPINSIPMQEVSATLRQRAKSEIIVPTQQTPIQNNGTRPMSGDGHIVQRLHNYEGSAIRFDPNFAQQSGINPLNSNEHFRSKSINLPYRSHSIPGTNNEHLQTQRKLKASSTWTEPEDRMLRALKEVKKLGWKEIATFFEGRTPNACQFRWRRIMSSLAAESKNNASQRISPLTGRSLHKPKESKRVHSIHFLLN